MSDRASDGMTYIPTLDGWRAVSIVLVIMHHMQIQCMLPILAPLLKSLSTYGGVGVELFFGISGLLICSRLLDEESRVGTINVKQFYLRRFFRIFPAASLYLVVIAIMAKCDVCPLGLLDWLGSLLFFRNYTVLMTSLHQSQLAQHWYTGHFWSLSMEEHFYLILPAVLVNFKTFRVWILGGLAVAVMLWRLVLAHLMHRNYQFGFRTDTHVDALLIPAMIALMLYPALRNHGFKRFLPAWSFPLLATVEIGLLAVKVPFFLALQAFIIPLLLFSTVLHPSTLPGKLLEYGPVRWIGWISYSLYLWQQLFFGSNFAGSPQGLAWLRQSPVSFLALILCATCSYYFVELPCKRLGDRFTTISARDGRRRVVNATFSHESSCVIRNCDSRLRATRIDKVS